MQRQHLGRDILPASKGLAHDDVAAALDDMITTALNADSGVLSPLSSAFGWVSTMRCHLRADHTAGPQLLRRAA